jgi:putative FmdB family regulatory protein
MPLYEYHCSRCGKNFEVIQKFVDEPLAVHEDCGGEVERLISTSALQFKGTGWYVTDYAKGGHSSAGNGSNGKSESKSENSTSDSKDSKPADTSSPAKSESKSSDKSKS